MVLFLIIAAYVGVTLAANTYATTLIELPLFGVVGVGTLFFGATFTLRDWIHQFSHNQGRGRKPVYYMIASAAIVNFLVAVVTGGEQFDIRIVLASCAAIIIAEATDTEIYQRLIKRNWYLRVAASNGVSAPLDSIIFTLLAFYGASYFPQELLIPVIYGDTLVKWAVGGLLALTKSVRDGAGAVLKGLNG